MIRPSFYDKFICKADKCTDTCCAGWLIEIDDKTMDKYSHIDSEFKTRFDKKIEYIDSQPCFCRDENERCVFLDKNGLCDIYSELGEDYLCDICREHPRFFDEYDSVVEAGLGLCCEKVCELLLENDFSLIYDIETDSLEYDIAALLDCRQKIIDILNDVSDSLDRKIKSVLDFSEKMQDELFSLESRNDYLYDKKSFFEFVITSYEKTEPINEKWGELILQLKNNMDKIVSVADTYSVDEEMYSKIMSYIIYRHFMQTRFSGEISAVVRMAVMAAAFMFMCECNIYSVNRNVTRDDKINIIKFWSQQIEYSSENTDYCLTIVQ